MKRILGIILAVFAMATVAQAHNVLYSGVWVSTNGTVSETAKASTQTYTMDVNGTGGDIITLQLVASSPTIASPTFTDGSISSFTITVVSTQGITGTNGSSSLTVLSTMSLTGAAINVNGFYINNLSWRTDFASNTAVDIANQIDLLPNIIASTATSTRVYVACASSGSFCNAYTLAVVGTSSITVSSPTFMGGTNAGSVGINGIYLTAGTDFAVGASTASAAINLAAAINANASLNTLVVASATTGSNGNWGVVWTSGAVVGTTGNYATFTSTQSAMKITPFTSSNTATGVASGLMLGGTNAGYSLNKSTITITSHSLTTGYGVVISTSNGVIPAPLVWGTTYYAIRVDANNFGLATTFANALAGTAIPLTSSRTLVTANTFTLATQNLSGTAVFQLQASNDGLNWNSVTVGNNGSTIAAVTFASAYAASSTLWDLGLYDFRYLRLLFTGPSTGGVAFTATINQKNNKSY